MKTQENRIDILTLIVFWKMNIPVGCILISVKCQSKILKNVLSIFKSNTVFGFFEIRSDNRELSDRIFNF